MTDALSKDLERQILDTHDRFRAAMAARIPNMDVAQRERYLALLNALVTRLEDRSKPLKQVLQELVAEALPLVMQELSSP